MTIRVAITQPDIRPYRLPVYNLLAEQPGVELSLFADRAHDAPNPRPEDMQFAFHHVPVVERRWGPLMLIDHAGQMPVVDPDRFDLVIHSWNARYRTLWPALRKARQVGLPTVIWGHGYSKNDSPVRVWLRHRMGRRATAIMLYTQPVARQMVERYGYDPSRVFVAQNAVDQTPIQAARADWLARPDDLAAFQTREGLKPDRTVAFVSRLRDENRPDRLVRAIGRLQADVPGATAVIVGDGPEREPLERLAAQLGVADRVRFTGGIYDEHGLAPWLLSSAVFCYPENVGLSLLTAFGFGLPAVTSDNLAGQNPEIAALSHEQNGLLYPYGDESAMAAAIGQILQDAELRARMSAAALRTVTEEFTLPNMVQGFLDAMRLVDGAERRVVVPETMATR